MNIGGEQMLTRRVASMLPRVQIQIPSRAHQMLWPIRKTELDDKPSHRHSYQRPSSHHRSDADDSAIGNRAPPGWQMRSRRLRLLSSSCSFPRTRNSRSGWGCASWVACSLAPPSAAARSASKPARAHHSADVSVCKAHEMKSTSLGIRSLQRRCVGCIVPQ